MKIHYNNLGEKGCKAGFDWKKKKTSKRNNVISESSIDKPLGLLANSRHPMICQLFRIFSRICLVLRKCNFFSSLLLSSSMDFRQPRVSWNFESTHWKSKRSASVLKCRFSSEAQSLIQPFLEPCEHNLGQKSSIKRLFQPTLGPISAVGTKSALNNWTVLALI